MTINSADFWNTLSCASEKSNWIQIRKDYHDNPNINIDYEPEADSLSQETILFLACVHQQFELAAEMIKRNPNANFTVCPIRGLYENRTIPLLVATSERIDILTKIIYSGQKIDLVSTPIKGVSPYWAMFNYGCWDLIHYSHINHLQAFPMDQSPDLEGMKGITPLWFAARSFKLDLIKQMLILNPDCDLNIAPLSGADEGKTPLWFILKVQQSPLRKEILDTFIFLGAECPINLPGELWLEYQVVKKAMKYILSHLDTGSQAGYDSFLKNYPLLKSLPKSVLTWKISQWTEDPFDYSDVMVD